MSNWDRFLDSFFNLKVAAEYLPKIIEGFWLTVLLALCIVVTGLVAGLLLAVLRSFGIRVLNWLIIFAVDLFRALPPLVLLVFVYAGLPFAGLELPAWAAVAIGFFLNTGAYYGEILRAGIESVPRGQMEAARSTGLTRGQAMEKR